MTMEGRQFRVNSKCDLLPYLLSLPLGLSRKEAKDLLRFHAVQVHDKPPARHDTKLQAGDVVTIALRKHPRDAALVTNRLKIVHLDDAIMVVDKPTGLLSMGSAREKEKTAHRILNEHLKALTNSRLQQIYIVHRLDRETSGLMVFARNVAVQAALQKNWKKVTKKYLAVVEGVPAQAHGTLKDNLAETKSLMVHRVAQGGEIAITNYRVIGRYGDRSLLELTLETGRRHQIRVQLAFRGHPIIGDEKYGARTDFARRLALHSYELRFPHPVSEAPMEFHSPLPSRLKELIAPRRPPPQTDDATH
jgi:23S rRNA pseudouridine1911/1915/1917 synthase